MKIELSNEKPKYNNLINNFILVLIGIFLSTVACSFLLHILPTIGVYLIFLFLGGAIYCGFKYTKKQDKLRMITWGVTTTLFLAILGFTAIFIIAATTNLCCN